MVVTRGHVLKCGKVGHKAAECTVYMVGETGPEDEKPIGEGRNEGTLGWRQDEGDFEMPAKLRQYKEGGAGRGERKSADDAGSLDAEAG